MMVWRHFLNIISPNKTRNPFQGKRAHSRHFLLLLNRLFLQLPPLPFPCSTYWEITPWLTWEVLSFSSHNVGKGEGSSLFAEKAIDKIYFLTATSTNYNICQEIHGLISRRTQVRIEVSPPGKWRCIS